MVRVRFRLSVRASRVMVSIRLRVTSLALYSEFVSANH